MRFRIAAAPFFTEQVETLLGLFSGVNGPIKTSSSEKTGHLKDILSPADLTTSQSFKLTPEEKLPSDRTSCSGEPRLFVNSVKPFEIFEIIENINIFRFFENFKNF